MVELFLKQPVKLDYSVKTSQQKILFYVLYEIYISANAAIGFIRGVPINHLATIRDRNYIKTDPNTRLDK